MQLVRVLSVLAILGVCAGAALADKYDTNEKDWSYGDIGTTAIYPEDEGVNNACPGQAIACGDDIEPAAINPAGDVDWINFYATQGTLITIGTDAYQGSSTDTYLELYAACGGGMIASDDDSGPGFFSLISNFPAPQTGYYYCKVRGYSTSTTGNYRMFVRCTEPTPPDPNDTCNPDYFIDRCTQGVLNGDMTWDANNYDPLSGGCATGYPEAGRDVAYKIDMVAGDIVDMTYVTPGFDAAFYVVTDCANVPGTCVIGADAAGDTEVIHWVVGATGTYWLILDHYGTNSGAGPWSLNYTFACPAPTGACCVGSVCSITTEANCQGTYQGDGTDCDPNPCPTPTEQTSWGQIKSNYR